jgi:hypothetical protein
MLRAPIGLKIRERRKAIGRTQASLAAQVGISASYLNLIEANKRQIGGQLLRRLADALDVKLETLDGAAERRLAEHLQELNAEPLLRGREMTRASAFDLVGRHPEWARALITLYRAYQDQKQIVNALSDRLNQDPFLSATVHGMLSHVAAIRSTAEILASVDDLEAGQRGRFDQILDSESRQLAGVATKLAAYFDKAQTRLRSLTPSEEVDDLLWERNNYFPVLEEAAGDLLRAAFADRAPDEAVMADHLAERHGIIVETGASNAVGTAGVEDSRPDGEGGRLVLSDIAPAATRRFQIARLLCALCLREVVEAEVHKSGLLSSPAARQLAVRALSSYAAGAMLMPYEPFLEDATTLRYDVGLLAHKHGVSFEQACHRLVTLRRPDAAGIPFAFMRTDPAGYVTKRFPLPRLPIPRYGNACPLWAVYSAFQNAGVIVRQLAELPAGDRFLFIARAVVKEQAVFGQHPHVVSIMLACDAVHADQTTYADGLDLAAPALAAPIGPTCRLCPRATCRHREEDPIVGSSRFPA